MLGRRLRAVAAFAVIWGLAWAPVGTLAALRHLVIDRTGLEDHVAAFVAGFTLFGAILGAVCGAAFAVTVIALARARPLGAVPLAMVICDRRRWVRGRGRGGAGLRRGGHVRRPGGGHSRRVTPPRPACRGHGTADNLTFVGTDGATGIKWCVW